MINWADGKLEAFFNREAKDCKHDKAKMLGCFAATLAFSAGVPLSGPSVFTDIALNAAGTVTLASGFLYSLRVLAAKEQRTEDSKLNLK